MCLTGSNNEFPEYSAVVWMYQFKGQSNYRKLMRICLGHPSWPVLCDDKCDGGWWGENWRWI